MKKNSLTDAHFGHTNLYEVSNKLNQKPFSREFCIYRKSDAQNMELFGIYAQVFSVILSLG